MNSHAEEPTHVLPLDPPNRQDYPHLRCCASRHHGHDRLQDRCKLAEEYDGEDGTDSQ